MRHRGFRPRLRAPDLERDDRLPGAPGLERCGAKPGGIAHSLDIESDDLGGFVLRKLLDEVGKFEVGFVARGHQLREADAARGGAGEQRPEYASALRHNPDGPRGKVIHFQRARGRKDNVVREIHEPNRVGAENPHRAGSFHELLLASGAFLAGFGIAAREHDGGCSAAGGKLAHRNVGALGTEQHDADIGDVWKRRDVWIATQIADLIHLRVDRIDSAGEAMLLQIRNRAPRCLRRISRCADDGNTAWTQELGDSIHLVTPSKRTWQGTPSRTLDVPCSCSRCLVPDCPV